jgi:hypothetical protein
MRKTVLRGCLALAFVGILEACSSTSARSTEGSGGAGTTTTTAPPAADGAWLVNLTNNGGMCEVMLSTRQVGDVSESAITTRVTDGAADASVSCSVSGSGKGPYSVDGALSMGADSLQISIPAISASATSNAPAVGSVAYESDATVSLYTSSACNFYFVTTSPESVAAGKIWVAFTCPSITSASVGSTCSLGESYAVFENCALTKE